MSRMSVIVRLAVGFACLFVGPAIFADNELFDARLAEAEENLHAEGGAKFDVALSHSFKDSKPTLDAVRTCMESLIPKPSLTGYFYFSSTGGYSVEVRPAGVFATCIRGAYSGREVHEPPRRPYANQFVFNVSN